MEVYFVRHGQTEWNKNHILQGYNKDSRLSEKGREEAIKLGKYFESVDFDKIYLSPLGRTRESYQYIIGERPIETILLEELREVNYGRWEGQKYSQLEEEYGKPLFKLLVNKNLKPLTGGENYSDVEDRVKKALEIIKSRGGERILVIGHGMWIKTLIASLLNKDILEVLDSEVIPNTSITGFRFDKDQVELITYGNIDHLR